MRILTSVRGAEAPPLTRVHRRPAPERAGSAQDWVKRPLELVLTVVGIALLFPLLAGIAILIKADSPGPVLYGHVRIGRDGRKFKCWKFRTMYTNGDAILKQHIKSDQSAYKEWVNTQKLRDDPRVTPLGKTLRGFSLDEVPQLFNVISGDMSLVGPRPIVADELRRYGTSSRYYLRTRPGITGLWQISGRNDICYSRRVALDRYYATKSGVSLDLLILAKTIPAVIVSRGAY